MSIKVLLLKSGEDVISDVQEMFSSDENVIGYLLTKPCVVKVRNKPPAEMDEDVEKDQAATSVTMYPWVPLARDQVIPLSTDWVVTMYNPQEKITEMYTEDVLKNFKTNDQTNSTIGSAEVGLTD
jgi:hypothetical protein